jgi:RimJ/RimL family protein N-acetyltransferase
MQYGFDTFKFDRLIAVPHSANRRSIRVAEKLGMAFEKKFMHNGVEVLCYARRAPEDAA